MEAFGKFMLVLMLASIVGFYSTWVLTKVIEWFNVPIQLSYWQWYGISSAIGLIILNTKEIKTNEKEEENKVFYDIIMKAIIFTFALLLSYLIHFLAR